MLYYVQAEKNADPSVAYTLAALSARSAASAAVIAVLLIVGVALLISAVKGLAKPE